MKNIFLILGIALMAVTFIACNENGNHVEVSIVEYNFTVHPNNSKWINLNYDNSVIIINSVEEMKKYLNPDSTYQIDFSKYTLLLTSSAHGSGIWRFFTPSLFQSSSNNYILKVRFEPTLASVITEWTLAILTSKKISNSAVITLDTEMITSQ